MSSVYRLVQDFCTPQLGCTTFKLLILTQGRLHQGRLARCGMLTVNNRIRMSVVSRLLEDLTFCMPDLLEEDDHPGPYTTTNIHAR